MRVNIIVALGDMEWICGRMARELAPRLSAHGIEAVINGTGGDLEYQQVVYGPPLTRPAVGLFTHGKDRPLRFATAYDGQVSMNSAMNRYLVEGGAEFPVIIEQPVVDNLIRKEPIVFGVAGRVYADGRKGEHLVAHMIRAGYNVLAWGHGWPCPAMSSNVADLPLFYNSIDYYVDTSSDEGGCTPALEAMARGIPVISHTVGVDRPVLAYRTHDWDSLNDVLWKLTHPTTYDDWAVGHASYFKLVLRLLKKDKTL